MSEKITRFLAEEAPETPCLVVDLEIVADNFSRLRDALPTAAIYYALKANPAPQILEMLNTMGCSFDAASIYEIESCLAAGAPPERLSFGNTIKKQAHIARAFGHGVRLFAFDSAAELVKLAAAAPGARVYCRFLTTGNGADWPLSNKFGCAPEGVVTLLQQAAELGLRPAGVSFHVGSQQRDLAQWDTAFGIAADIFAAGAALGMGLEMINIGGGFPARYRAQTPTLDDYAGAVMDGMARHFGNRFPAMIVEPGRCLPGDAGVIQSEVVLISRKSEDDQRRWVYLDIGKFGGLVEVMDESIQYRLRTPHDGGPTGPVVIAGPTCDEVDIL
ncbi:MAG: type III PLP-dependent enzyme, partial [Alphaproteobacteria bacterium]